MPDSTRFYINGDWRIPRSDARLPVEHPGDRSVLAEIALASAEDVDDAVSAAKAAQVSFSLTTVAQREAWLSKLLSVYKRRYAEVARAISQEMGAPIDFADEAQAYAGQAHIEAGIKALQNYRFSYKIAGGEVVKESIGVCALITPWNWPINQIACKVVPALATGCTMVLKPSEISPLSALLWTEMIDEIGLPPGAYNMINGNGGVAGKRLVSHPDVDMVSFTGSTRAGVAIAMLAAPSVKRVTQELGGKSPNIILEGADLETVVAAGVRWCMSNSGQSCNAPTRMLLPKKDYDVAIGIARRTAQSIAVGDPSEHGDHIGPVSSSTQYDRVQSLIAAGIEEGALLICGGMGHPEGWNSGYHVKPTVFANVNNSMRIAREEVFGPVLTMIPYIDLDDAVAIANDTPYGLAAYVQGDLSIASSLARQLHAGMVHVNGAEQSFDAPFGGYKQSGNGREWGTHGFEDYLETKMINGG